MRPLHTKSRKLRPSGLEAEAQEEVSCGTQPFAESVSSLAHHSPFAACPHLPTQLVSNISRLASVRSGRFPTARRPQLTRRPSTAELEASIANGTATSRSHPTPQLPPYDPASVALTRVQDLAQAPNFSHLADSPDSSGAANIGAGSLDWRLATPQMASALSQHLCDGKH